MRRATVTIGDELEKDLDDFLKAQDPAPSLTAVVQAALRYYLRERARLDARQYQPPSKPLEITPAEQGSGADDVSLRHDQYLTD